MQMPCTPTVFKYVQMYSRLPFSSSRDIHGITIQFLAFAWSMKFWVTIFDSGIMILALVLFIETREDWNLMGRKVFFLAK